MRASAHVYGPGAGVATWQLTPSPLECRLSQQVPDFGEAVFLHRAGTDMTFFLHPLREVKYDGLAVIRSVPPEWRYDTKERFIAKVPVKRGERPFEASDDLASRLLAELLLGMFPTISHKGWYPMHPVDIAVSSVNFSAAYEDYLSCARGLFAKNFDQLERTSVLFKSDKWDVSEEYFPRFEMLYDYVQLDPEVSRIYVDGHADARGGDDYNWDLSRLRAEEVQKLLLLIGFDPDFIVLRYHGERHPSASNSSENTRSKNRRVTLRLAKDRVVYPQ